MRWFRNRRTGLVEAWSSSGDVRRVVGAKFANARDRHVRVPLYEEITPSDGGGSSAFVENFLPPDGNTAVVGGTGADLLFVDAGGLDLLDLANPANPKVVDAGCYAVTYFLNPATAVPGETAEFNSYISQMTAVLDLGLKVDSDSGRPFAMLCRVCRLSAGARIGMFVDHSDTGVSHNFSATVTVVKLST